ncbi:RDD family protein [Amycolatopsis benzoatilytica]|uniref:RDD family protein n=1 Tax=Amycolatopsis benzoatilytica TaxID=346045 RepID=UPI0003757759|nr:RDD family protein [Amycolatopsis benzoatilytica]
MQEESELVTGEAVVLDLRVAKLASRAVAMLLDVLVQAAVLLLALVALLVTAGQFDRALTVALMLTVFVLVVIGYPVLFETLSRGRSLGKLALGLRVVRLDGGPISFRHALTRALAGFFVDFWALGFLGAVAVVVSLSSSNGRRVGDYLAGTLVIRERVPLSKQAVLMVPPGLEHWAAQFDLSGLPEHLATAARQYLGRYHDLRPEAAASLGFGLAQQVSAAIGVPLPYGMPPWVFLTAVLGERRNRDQARIAPPGYPLPGYPAQVRPGQAQPAQVHQPGQGQPGVGQPGPPDVAPPGFALPGASRPVPATEPVPLGYARPAEPLPAEPKPEPDNPFTLPS